MKTIRHAAGSLLVVGLSATELSPLERSWLKLIGPAGVILFRRNIVDAPQTRHLLGEATVYCSPANLRCVDIEGGSVDRLRDAVAPMPSAQAVAATGKLQLMRKHGELIANETLAFGFNTTLAPVLDLALPVSATVMGTRSAAANADGVTQYANAFLDGLRAHGAVGCGKHFPGLGGGTVDSHLHTPAINRSFQKLWTEDIVPYRRLITKLPMIMVTHAAYPETRGTNKPATASSFWIKTILQDRMKFKGLIFSDDMEMGGILKYMSIEEAAIAAILSGMHLLEICHSPELILRCYESLLREAERSAVFRVKLLARAQTCKRLRRAHFNLPMGRPISKSQMAVLRDQILKFAKGVQEGAS